MSRITPFYINSNASIKVVKKCIERRIKLGKRAKPAILPEARENQLINLAINLAEEKLRNGTASSQIITTLLNHATTKYQLENEKLRSDLRVADAKIKAMQSSEDTKDMYQKAIKAFRSYQGNSTEEEYEDEWDD